MRIATKSWALLCALSCGSSEPDLGGAEDAEVADGDATRPHDGAVSEDAEPADGGEDEPWRPAGEPCGPAATLARCEMAGYPSRTYNAWVPAGVDVSRPTPVVVLFHGGSGNALAALRGTCPGRFDAGGPDLSAPSCIHRVADREGFVVIFPNGTGTEASPERRTWNAGGGREGWHCVSGVACQDGVDDITYVEAVLEHLDGWLNVDDGAVFATGLSNGGALSHRVACELADQFAAIAPVGGANQYETLESCMPAAPVAVLQVHGYDDPCWTWDRSGQTCAPIQVDLKAGAVESTEGWARRNECRDSTTETEDDVDGDGRFTIARRWTGCRAPVALLRLEGAGHTMPNGFQYRDEAIIGATLRDWGMERIWSFFDLNRRN